MLFSRGREKTYIIQFADLKSREPLLAFFFAVLLFSRSGIPPFAGFFVKLDVLSALFDSSNFFLNYIFFFFTVASFFYYLRVIKMLFFDESNTSYLPKMVQNTSSNSMIEYPRAEIRY
jgi:NADH-quinone oxidoreductase subunit N